MQLDNITLREIAYAIAQIYEYFESFLFDILAVYQIEKDGNSYGSNSFDQVRLHLKKELRGRNNSDVLKMKKRV